MIHLCYIYNIPDGVDEAIAWSGGWQRYHQNCCKGEHKYCIDQCYQILDPWHNYTMTHIRLTPSVA